MLGGAGAAVVAGGAGVGAGGGEGVPDPPQALPIAPMLIINLD